MTHPLGDGFRVMQNHSILILNSAGVLAPATTKTAEIAVILDRSGSMEAIATDAIGGFNAFAANQDAIASANRLSIPVTDAEGFTATCGGTRAGFSRLSDRVAEKRSQ